MDKIDNISDKIDKISDRICYLFGATWFLFFFLMMTVKDPLKKENINLYEINNKLEDVIRKYERISYSIIENNSTKIND